MTSRLSEIEERIAGLELHVTRLTMTIEVAVNGMYEHQQRIARMLEQFFQDGVDSDMEQTQTQTTQS